MPADHPTILATSGGCLPGRRTHLTLGPLVHHALDLSGVHGRSVVNLLAVWRAHGLEAVLRRAWQAGVVLAGVSAGSICWHTGGTTDSFGPQLRAVTNGLGFLPYANGVHHDSDPARRPALERFVADGTLGLAHCTDDGVGLVYGGATGVELVETVTEVPGKAAWVVQREGDGTVSTQRLEPRLLPAVR